MVTKSTKGPAGFLSRVDNLEAGTKQNIVGKATVKVAGVPMTAAQILAKLQAVDGSYASVNGARVTLATAMAAWKAQLPDARAFVSEYVAALKAEFGTKNPILQSFGLSPAKPKPPRTAAEKAVSAAMGSRTRTARGTKGPKQKAKITSEGRPGLVLVSPTGEPLEGNVPGPIAPAGGDAAAAGSPSAASSSAGGGTPSGK
ncbi:MAG: hypothetical protein ACYCWW_04960 [Deltaproteobacteria bacterium]